ncbi:MAG: cytochrome c4 [Halieaceae bacterium]|nr:cytochrome c4 [Halieaceae bacterium]MCP5147487.1 cytochrome c4 [Pseudomonadales bacterium]MCP5166136.1 cytochrome c4 [Pseudomonadales bacterium]MCP5187181.1 cytochrome c4 [Pseudomonadales bacterium]
MKKIAILFGLAMGCAQYAYSAEPMPAGDAAAGEAQTMVCAACHGADGNSAVPTFPKLAGQGQKYLYKQLQDIRDGARPVPTMAGQLDGKSNQDLADIAAYYAAQSRTGGQTDPELLALGEAVYRGGIPERDVAACTACHSPTGAGNAPAGFPALAGQHAEYIAAQLVAYRRGYEDETGRINDGDTRIMRITAFGLSDREIEAVSSYAAGLY